MDPSWPAMRRWRWGRWHRCKPSHSSSVSSRASVASMRAPEVNLRPWALSLSISASIWPSLSRPGWWASHAHPRSARCMQSLQYTKEGASACSFSLKRSGGSRRYMAATFATASSRHRCTKRLPQDSERCSRPATRPSISRALRVMRYSPVAVKSISRRPSCRRAKASSHASQSCTVFCRDPPAPPSPPRCRPESTASNVARGSGLPAGSSPQSMATSALRAASRLGSCSRLVSLRKTSSQ
mmetsp:Transcript_14145/g.40208  ORF Transcript_14145/g.40208 Transcript_14145/m.40208 type:complete len:241 (-) Transcript_14145:490-1212(-)